MATIAIQVGLSIAGTVLNALFAPKPPPQEGPRLNDLNLPSVNPGNPIVRVYGSPSVGPQIIWTSGLQETKHTTKVKGGKGGGGKSQTQITYTYSADVAMAVCEGPVNRVRRIWANNKLLYSNVVVPAGPIADAANKGAAAARALASAYRTRANDILDNDHSGEQEKRDLLNQLNRTPTQLAIIAEGMTALGLSSDPLYEGWDAFNAYLDTLDPPLTDDDSTHFDFNEMQTAFNDWIGLLEEIAAELTVSVYDASKDYIDDQIDQEVDDLVTEIEAPDNVFMERGAEVDTLWVNGVAKKTFHHYNENSPPPVTTFSLMMAPVDDPIGGGGGGSYSDQINSSGVQTSSNYNRINVYLGTRDQMPDDIMEAALGVGEVPAYRGICYFVIDELQLADYGNTLPTFKVEVEQGDADGKTSLKTIVVDLCTRAGLDNDEYDVDSLTDKTLEGVAVTQPSSGRDMLELLQNVCEFDVVESNYAVKFVDRYGRMQARLRPLDFAATEFDTDSPPAKIETTRTMPDELPREITFAYQDPTRNYSVGTARARRAVTDANLVENVELPIVLDPTEAKTAVDRLMSYRYSKRRAYKLILPIKYYILDPGDAVFLPLPNGGEKRVRITSMVLGGNNLIEMALVDHYPPVDEVSGLAYTPEIETPAVFPAGDTIAHLLDVPTLTETEDDTIAGFYVAFSRTSKGWPGGSLFVDDGSGGTIPYPGATTVEEGQTTWTSVASSQFEVAVGTSVSPMIAASPYLWDRTSRLVLGIITPDVELSSTTETDLLRNAKNTIVINGEIIQYATVTDLGSGFYELRDLLRGRRGSDPFIAAHPAGSEVIFIDPDNVTRYVMGNNLIGIERSYKSATFGQDIGDVDPFTFAGEGNWLKPLAPCHVRRTDETDGSITLSWLPRVRQGGIWQDKIDPTIDQSKERYTLGIYDSSGNFKRSMNSVDGQREVVYTSAMQDQDFGGRPGIGAMTVKVYQIGDVVGLGFTNPIAL